ncbi:Dephospho-CoA kinase [Capsicum annuum]|nr:Dephospho-CoA kinase [Capsicum annuum]KAF3648139.1 Dephospho-CoA kinase [Capsicum annuum]
MTIPERFVSKISALEEFTDLSTISLAELISALQAQEQRRVYGKETGKSTVSNLFKAHGIPVVDADIVASNVLKKGTDGWKKVVDTFSEDIILDNGEVDRAMLGQIVFDYPGKRQLLNSAMAVIKDVRFDYGWDITSRRSCSDWELDGVIYPFF